MAVRPFRVCKYPLTTNEAVEILDNISEEQISTLPPVKPKAGELYIYWASSSSKAGYIYSYTVAS